MMPAEHLDNVPALLSRINYFREMRKESLQRLAENAFVLSLNRGDVLVAQGTTHIGGVYAVLSGQVHLSLSISDTNRSLRLLEPGMTLGETVLLMQSPVPYEAVATRKSRILVIDGKAWVREIQRSPEVAWEVLRHMAERRIDSMKMLAASSRRTDLSRVAGYIMERRPKLHSESFSFELPARKMDIASILGMSNASFSRVLHQLKARNVIHVNGSFIQVLKATVLNQLASGAAAEDAPPKAPRAAELRKATLAHMRAALTESA